MKTRKLWSVLMALVLTFAAPTFFSSCSNDIDEKEVVASLVGLGNGVWSVDLSDDEWIKNIRISFYPDMYGVVTEFARERKLEGAIVEKKHEFIYSVDGDMLHIVTTDGIVADVRYFISGRTMILNYKGKSYLFIFLHLVGDPTTPRKPGTGVNSGAHRAPQKENTMPNNQGHE